MAQSYELDPRRVPTSITHPKEIARRLTPEEEAHEDDASVAYDMRDLSDREIAVRERVSRPTSFFEEASENLE